MKPFRTILILAACMMLMAVAAVAEQDKGGAAFDLYGGKTGKVPFPHHQHQTALAGDCKACHDLFPPGKRGD